MVREISGDQSTARPLQSERKLHDGNTSTGESTTTEVERERKGYTCSSLSDSRSVVHRWAGNTRNESQTHQDERRTMGRAMRATDDDEGPEPDEQGSRDAQGSKEPDFASLRF